MFFQNIYDLKDEFNKSEFLSQIKKGKINLVNEGLDDILDEYELLIELVKTKSNELEIIFKENGLDLKEKLSGITITNLELEEIDIDSEENLEENKAIFKRLDSVLNKIRENKKIIDNKRTKLEMTDEGIIVYKSNIGICDKCGNLLDRDSKYCKICGTKI